MGGIIGGVLGGLGEWERGPEGRGWEGEGALRALCFGCGGGRSAVLGGER